MLRNRGDFFFGEFSDLKVLVRRQGKEHIYLCPYCQELGKKQDDKGKFYFNFVKNIGHCWRCETVVVSSAIRSTEVIRQQLNEKSEGEKYLEQVLSIDSWTCPIEEERSSYHYMINDRKIFTEVLRLFNVRACTRPRTGIVFCNKIWKDEILGSLTDFLTIRNVFSHVKHTILREQVKPLLWSTKLFSQKLIVVEGTISGLSAYQHLDGELSPIVLLGKTLSEFQKGQLRDLTSKYYIKEIYICCDGGYFENSLKIAKEVYSIIIGTEVLVTKLPWNKDPNQLTRKEFKEAFSKSWLYEPLRASLIRKEAYNK
jgi:hypothetical protein